MAKSLQVYSMLAVASCIPAVGLPCLQQRSVATEVIYFILHHHCNFSTGFNKWDALLFFFFFCLMQPGWCESMSSIFTKNKLEVYFSETVKILLKHGNLCEGAIWWGTDNGFAFTQHFYNSVYCAILVVTSYLASVACLCIALAITW